MPERSAQSESLHFHLNTLIFHSSLIIIDPDIDLQYIPIYFDVQVPYNCTLGVGLGGHSIQY